MKRISYAELIKNENIILCNNIVNLELEPYCGSDYDEEDNEYALIYQYYIITEQFAEYLSQATDETVFYCPMLEVYVWGVTHFGTAWSGVYLDIKTYDELISDK